MILSSLPSIKEIIKNPDLRAQKKLGQHFLTDTTILQRIALAAPNITKSTVIEIGPGPGGLTRALLETHADRVIVVEKDHRFLPYLEELRQASSSLDRLLILHGDALKMSCHTLGNSPRQIVANLPYNVGTTLLFQWLENIQEFTAFTVMLQKEVAQRLAAKPGTSVYGRLSIMVQWLCEVKCLFDVPPSAFTPAPKVTSTVIQIIPRPVPLYEADAHILSKIIRLAFGQRRKIIRSSLRSLGENIENLLLKSGINPLARPEVLTLQDFCALARIYKNINIKQ